MNCIACGERYRDEGRFCPFCGVLLRLACSHCGHLNCRSKTVCSECATPLQTTVLSTPSAVPPGRPLERRQLTMMFTDLVNSTALSDQLDPEDFRVLIEAHRTAAVAPIKSYGGVVARYLGDGMLIYFGYPEAHEDDPDRAVRAGLEIVEATKAMNERWVGEGRGKIAVRIGIHTGIVVVGDVIKQDVQEPMAVFGNPPSLAARLQDLAQPNSVVLSGATKALLRPTVKCLPRGQTILKGIAKPVDIFTASETEGRSIGDPAAKQARKVLPFVNRQKELSALRLGWISAKKGAGKAFMLTGDPGIGKSRLIRALEERVASRRRCWLVARTSPYAVNSDFFAFSELFHGLLQPTDNNEVNVDGYELLKGVLVEQGLAEPNHALGFAHLLGIEIPGDAASQGLQPERLRDLTLGAIAAWFERQSAAEPLALVIEDLHWADASTLEAIKLLLSKLSSTHILMVMSSRESDVLGDAQDHVETLAIERLPPDYAKTLLDHVVQDAHLPESSIETLLERSAGVPLFLEELPKPVLEGGMGGGAAGLDTGSDPVALPATLRDSLMAQLDRMGVGKPVAQTGAVLGHSFDEALIRRVYGGGLRQMEEGLEILTEAGLLTRHDASPNATYAFKHALLAEIAYDSLLRQECRQIHRRTADALVAHFPTLTDSRPELIARHYAAANDSLVAFDYWMRAGKAAARRSANTEAIGHLKSAEAELAQLKAAGVEDLDEKHLELFLVRGPVLEALVGWSVPEVEENYRTILTLAQALTGRQQEHFNAWAGLCNVYMLRGDLKEARHTTEQMQEIVKRTVRIDFTQRWHRLHGLGEFLSARFLSAIENYGAALDLNEVGQPARHTSARGINPDVIAHSIKAWSHWFLGQSDRAKDASSLAIATAVRAEHPFSQSYAFSLASSLAQCCCQSSIALSHAERAIALSDTYGFPYWHAWATIIKGWALAVSGDPNRGLFLLTDGISRYEATGSAQMHGYHLCLLAEAYKHAHRWQDVVDASSDAVAEMKRTGIVFYQAEAYRLLGEGLSHLGSGRVSNFVSFGRALQVARKQESLPLFLRISSSLFEQYQNPSLEKAVHARITTMLHRAREFCSSSEWTAAETQSNEWINDPKIFPERCIN